MEVRAIVDEVEPLPVNDPVLRARGGDFEAFAELYRLHVGKIYSLCRRMVRDPARAEELTQEAFIRAWEKLDRFRGGPGFPAWLHRLTVNVVHSDSRSRARRQGKERPLNELEGFDERQETRKPAAGIDLERAIELLPDGARRIFVLHDVEGYRHEEIAELLGISSGGSRSQLHRARRLLREALKR